MIKTLQLDSLNSILTIYILCQSGNGLLETYTTIDAIRVSMDMNLEEAVVAYASRKTFYMPIEERPNRARINRFRGHILCKLLTRVSLYGASKRLIRSKH